MRLLSDVKDDRCRDRCTRHAIPDKIYDMPEGSERAMIVWAARYTFEEVLSMGPQEEAISREFRPLCELRLSDQSGLVWSIK